MPPKSHTNIHGDPLNRLVPDLRPQSVKDASNPPASADMPSTTPSQSYRALIFGASGITGWAIVNAAVQYPSPNTFEQITGLTNRPLKAEDAHFPQDPRIVLHSGFDLSKADKIVNQLSQIQDVEKVTHVYFAAYTAHGSSYADLKEANVEILRNAVEAVDKLCPKLLFFTLQTGGKAYGIEFADKIEWKVPAEETFPRIPQPYADNIFYYAQYDYLSSFASSKSWKFCEVRPDVIIGFVPHNNGMNLAQSLGLFLAFWKFKKGANSEVPFPGDEIAWTSKHSDTSQDVLAKFHIFASLHPDDVDGKAFNVADGDVVSWSMVWDGICQFFGLRGIPPNGSVSGAQWMKEQRIEWEGWEKEHGLKAGTADKTGWDFMEAIVGAKVDRQYDLGRSRAIGFEEKYDTIEGYHVAFERMRKAKQIP